MSISLSKRLVALMFAVAVTSSLLVACGDDDDSSTSSATPTATVRPTAEEEPDEEDEETAAATMTATPQMSTPAATVTAEPSGLGGTWSGAYVSTSHPGEDGTFVIEWTQTGSALSGTINVTNSPCVSLGTITGTVQGSQITFGAVEGTFSISYEGTVAGSTMSGSYSSPSCGNATGTWEASKQ